MTSISRFVPLGAPGFPRLLAEIPAPPIGLYIRGTLGGPAAPTVAIVGTRRATPAGKMLAQELARGLALRGFVIVSGLAFGIDAAAHEGCLLGGGQTIAVLPCGADKIYPRSNAGLAERILQNGGALLSEYPPGTPALPHRFLERNRLVSGLARGVLIIEAPARSGALATARFAAEQGRECLVIPGPVSHPNYEGSHELIRKGATLATKIDHVLEVFGLENPTDPATPPPLDENALSEIEKKIWALAKKAGSPIEVDKIVQIAKLQPQAVNIALTMLVVKGVMRETAEGYALK